MILKIEDIDPIVDGLRVEEQKYDKYFLVSVYRRVVQKR